MPEYHDLAVRLYRRPDWRGHAKRKCYALFAVGRVRDHAAADGAAEISRPQLIAGLGDGLLLHQLRHYIPLWSKLRATLPQKTGPEKLCGVLERPGYLSDATRRRAGAGTRRP